MEVMKEFINILKNNPDSAYDFVSNNYYKMSKEELRDIVKELLYAVNDNVTQAEHNKILDDVAEELNDFYVDVED